VSRGSRVREFSLSRRAALENDSTSSGRRRRAGSMRKVYACVLKNSSLEIPGNPIFPLADSAAGSLPEHVQPRDKESDIVERV
jgi:hypothetical protein